MSWDAEASNPMVTDEPGIWVAKRDGVVVLTWNERDPNGGPTHWRLSKSAGGVVHG